MWVLDGGPPKASGIRQQKRCHLHALWISMNTSACRCPYDNILLMSAVSPWCQGINMPRLMTFQCPSITFPPPPHHFSLLKRVFTRVVYSSLYSLDLCRRNSYCSRSSNAPHTYYFTGF
ncbi:hypothetical protein TRVL_01186 [Trypanosoma vivax]|nr:hypothetical protein TRVL_01186 [Trypanosoma vivax]